MDYNQLKFDIAQVIRTNGNEEITGEVLQYILLEMVSHLGLAYQFAGVATTETEPGEPDENKAWLIGAGTYTNFGDEFTIADNELGVVTWNGVFTVKKITTGRAVVNELRIGSTNPVEGGIIAQQFAQLRAAGYLFVGLATPATEPPAERPEKIFYLAAQGGAYPNFSGIVVPQGVSTLKWNGSTWTLETLWTVDDTPTEDSPNLVKSGGVYTELEKKVDKVEGKGLSEANFTNAEKQKLGDLPTATQIAGMLDLKQNVLDWDNTPTDGSLNPVTSDGIYEAIKNFITKAVDDLINYYTKNQVYTKSEVENLIAAIKQFNILAVPELPTASASTVGTLYLVPSERQGEHNVKDEYITLSVTEGQTTIYYWEKIGTTEIDLSNYTTFDDVNAAIATALANYYTKTQIDTMLAAAEGRLATVEISADKSIILVDDAVSVSVIASTDITATSLTISRDGIVKATGSGKALTTSEIVLESAAGSISYLLTAIIGGVTRTKEVSIEVVDAVYYGAGTSATDIVTKATARKTPAGRYSIVAAAGDNLFILVPQGMSVNGMRMNGIEVPLEVPTGVVVDSKQYLCYQSSNVYDAGTYVIEVY